MGGIIGGLGGASGLAYTYIALELAWLWTFSCSACAFVFGMYLFVSVNYIGVHWNEAFSSLRIANFKNFVKMKVDASGAGTPRGGKTATTITIIILCNIIVL